MSEPEIPGKLGTAWAFGISATAILTLVFSTLYATNMIYADETRSGSVLWLTVLIRSVLIAVALGASGLLFVTAVIRNDRLDGRVKRSLTMPLSVFVLVLFLELVFMFVPRSHGTGITLAERVWDSLYWQDINSLGFRDHEPPTPGSETQYVLVVGDSFTEGHGIRFIEQRYTGLLQARLGSPYKVLNLGASGSDTRRQYKNLETYPIPPDIVILQYFGNDIEEACRQHGKTFVGFQFYSDVPGFAKYLVTHSFFFNFAYWLFPHDAGNRRYAGYLQDCYGDESVLEEHFRDLDRFVEYAIDRQVPLLVLIFPFLEENTDAVNRYVSLVGSHLEARGVLVISVADLIQSLPPGDRVVNRSDGHASTKVHEAAARALLRWFQSRGR